MHDKVFDLANCLPAECNHVAAEMFIELIRNDWLHNGIIERMIEIININIKQDNWYGVRRICEALIATKKEAAIGATQDLACTFVCNEQFSDRGLEIFKMLLGAGFKIKLSS